MNPNCPHCDLVYSLENKAKYQAEQMKLLQEVIDEKVGIIGEMSREISHLMKVIDRARHENEVLRSLLK